MEELIDYAKRSGIAGFLMFGSSMILLSGFLSDLPSWAISMAKAGLVFGAIVLAASVGFVMRARRRAK
ncbi:hypothetical protein [Burkholderia cenocepacia]|uniref:hypothetical protein n=1 Tax=Burkholderia cenocepacia TaxID=95486 RepID=UPI0013E0708A|nr:hypothetical protein [Burkholderia cenocepacia]MCW3587333.1 hypothetical protein [Burkholderia cenocepacia]MCW3632537.1 hypothetical protein [Burkholderia cenocepacia]MCW5181767.1 hypothetical protein [Burkholderia cenocepacia]NGO98097.1 hypothetical protein [Burkholderia cenocepacia]